MMEGHAFNKKVQRENGGKLATDVAQKQISPTDAEFF
jgi:hypothetical protein